MWFCYCVSRHPFVCRESPKKPLTARPHHHHHHRQQRRAQQIKPTWPSCRSHRPIFFPFLSLSLALVVVVVPGLPSPIFVFVFCVETGNLRFLVSHPPPPHPADFPPHQIKLEAKGVELFSFFFQTFHAVSLNQKEKVNESAARGIGRYCAHSTIPSSCRGERERAGVGRISQRESLIDPLGRRGRHKRKTKRPERDRDCARGAGETCDEWIGSALTLRPAVSHTRGSTCVHLCSVVSSSPPGCRYLFRVCTGSGACALPLVDGPRPKATSVSSFSAAPPALLPHRSPRRRRCFVVRSCVCVCVCVWDFLPSFPLYLLLSHQCERPFPTGVVSVFGVFFIFFRFRRVSTGPHRPPPACVFLLGYPWANRCAGSE